MVIAGGAAVEEPKDQVVADMDPGAEAGHGAWGQVRGKCRKTRAKGKASAAGKCAG